MNDSSEARRSRRLALQSAAPAFFGGIRVSLLDVSVGGVGVRHIPALHPGESGTLEFTFEGERVILPCTVVYSHRAAGGKHYRSGLRIHDDANVRLSAFIRRLARWERNGSGATGKRKR